MELALADGSERRKRVSMGSKERRWESRIAQGAWMGVDEEGDWDSSRKSIVTLEEREKERERNGC